MTKFKKFSIFFCSLMLVITGLFLAGCGGIDYSSISLSCSESSVDMKIGETKELTFTINNFQEGMSDTLSFNKTGNSIKITPKSPKNGQTVVTIEAVESGITTLIAKSEGQKQCQVIIEVLKPSSIFENGQNTLYVTENKSLKPTSADFKFDSDTKLRDVKFYFYGIASGESLSLDDIKVEENLLNEFIDVSLVRETTLSENYYLLFTDINGNKFTITEHEIADNSNVFFEFVEVVEEEENYIFPPNAFTPSIGQKLTFMAVYPTNDGEMFTQRDFYVYKSIDESSIQKSFAYQTSLGVLYDEVYDENSDEIYLVTNKVETTESGFEIDYRKIIADFSLPENDLIGVEVNFQDQTNFNKIAFAPTTSQNRTHYIYEISSNTMSTANTILNVRFFYKDLKDVQDSEVSVELEIPIYIVHQPTSMVVNNEKGNASLTKYLFYNQSLNDSIGWQKFNISLSPIDANFDYAVVNFDQTEVMVRYKNKIYNEGSLILENSADTIDIKGKRASGKIGDGQVTITAVYSIFEEKGNITDKLNLDNIKEKVSYAILYSIENGATDISFTDDYYKNQGIYLTFDQEKTYTFDALRANGNFNSVSVSFDGKGKDVASFIYRKGENNSIILEIKTKAIGEGQYTVALDNGYSRTLKVNVVETIETLSLEQDVESSELEDGEDKSTSVIKRLDIQKNQNGTYSGNLYIFNELNDKGEGEFNGKVKVNLITNGSLLSQAISAFAPPKNNSSVFLISYTKGNYIVIDVTTLSNGSAEIKLVLTTSFGGQDFKYQEQDVELNLTLASYTTQTISVEKERDGKGQYDSGTSAAYAYVYTGTDSLSSRSVKFNVISKSQGFLFEEPGSNPTAYKLEEFSQKFVYFTMPGQSIYQNGRLVSLMKYVENGNNDYTIEGFGSFNTQTMTFTILKNAPENANLDLIVWVSQYNYSHSYPIRIQTSRYIEVSELSLQEECDQINFSALKFTKDLVVHLSDANATTKDVRAYFISSGKVDLFGKNGLKVEKIGSNGLTYLVSLDVSSFVGSEDSYSEDYLGGTLIIAPTDWLDASGKILNEYYTRALKITINYQNGTEANPFIIETADDVLNIKDAPNAHYALYTTINMSEHNDKLPLCEFGGTLVGKNQFAKIVGLKISKGLTDSANVYYGLFSSLTESAKIEYIDFVGSFEIKTNTSSEILVGLIAGENNGTIINVAVQMNANSTISSNGTIYFGAVAGKNNGDIIQDFSKFTDEDSIYLGMETKGLVYAGNYTTTILPSKNSQTTIYAGGVTGANAGAISKIDNEELTLLGYANYMSYNNIVVDYANGPKPNDYVGGIAGISTSASSISASGWTGGFTKGKGLVVGGLVRGYNTVGGVVGKFDGSSINGITVRTFVRGYENVGAIIALGSIGSGDITNKAFAVQAVDDLRTGIEASMVIKYSSRGDTSIDKDKIAFGLQSNYNFITLYTYLTREYITNSDNTQNLQITREDTTSYYGDYIELGTSGTEPVVIYQYQFSEDAEPISVKANVGFKPYTILDELNNPVETNNYYMFYFEAGYVRSSASQNVNILDIQKELDLEYNTLTLTNNLYPILPSAGLVLTSQNNDIVSIDQNGKITSKRTGRAVVKGMSVLNANNSLTFTLNVTNYFNQSEQYSVVYPSMSPDDEPLKGNESDYSEITIRGNQMVNQFVRPNYTLEKEIKNGETEIVIDKEGSFLFNNIAVTLATNQTLSIEAEVTKVNLIDSTSTSTIDVTIIGQTITLSRNEDTEEGRYKLTLTPVLKQNIDGKEYKVELNKKLDNVRVIYVPGANSINTINYDSVRLTTGQIVKENIVIDSPIKEDKPLYSIVDEKGKVLQGTFANGKMIEEVEVSKRLFNFEILDNANQELLQQQVFNFNLSVNINSEAYQNRYTQNIYGEYYLHVYANSDTTKHREIKIIYENINVKDIIVDNYSNFDKIQSNKVLGSSSEIAIPGSYGMLAINVTPETADFDYIEIQNTSLASVVGNGMATFNLLARNKNADEKLFEDVYIAGSISSNKLILTMDDIISVYNRGDYEDFRGIIYIKYAIGSLNVSDGGKAEFSISVYKKDAKVEAIKTLDLSIQNHINISLENKNNKDEAGYYSSYDVARGLKYKINIEKYGFDDEEFNITSNNSAVEVIKENNEYYLQISSSVLPYDENGELLVEILASASHTEGDLVKTASSKMKLNVKEFVIEYNIDVNDGADIIKNMENGYINVQIGNKITLSVDINQFIEYDQTNQAVLAQISAFMTNLSNLGQWDYTADYGDAGNTTIQNIQSTKIDDIFVKSNGGLTITPIYIHTPTNRKYFFTYTGYFSDDKNGIYKFDKTNGNEIHTEFTLNVYVSSSEENPIPIYEYDDLTSMNDGAHYILLGDITLPETFKPIKANFKTFDGNGHTIRFLNNYDFDNLSNLGLFASIPSGSMVKNLNVAVAGGYFDVKNNRYIAKFKTTASSFNFGLIAGENNGAIANCYTYSEYSNSANITSYISIDSALENSGYIAGIVGTNSGSITNSRSSIYAVSPFNLAGVVGVNSGKIASTYFKNGVLIGTSSTGQNIAGFAISNTSNAQILTSYVSGENTTGSVYSKDEAHYISSTTPQAGFIYENSGYIRDCYSNIDMKDGTTGMAGFVYHNAGSGTIRNSFSTSILKNSVTSSAGFAMDESQDNGAFENCYYLTTKKKNNSAAILSQSENNIDNIQLEVNNQSDINTSYETTGENKTVGEAINEALKPIYFDGITELYESEFDVTKNNYFAEYVYSNSPFETNSIWFFSKDESKNIDVFGQTNFATGRLELISANIVAFSQQELLDSMISENGDVKYTYKLLDNSAEKGTITNPRVVHDALSFETEIVERTTASGFNNQYIRLANDVDYSTFEGLSKTYKTIFGGTLEGNGLSIKGASLNSTERLNSAGMFAQIGRTAYEVGTIMNVAISPSEVTFNNTTNVGALAGTAKFANLFYVDVDGANSMTVNGKNFVGGIVGKAITSYNFKYISSTLNAVANYKPQQDVIYVEGSSNDTQFSYAGGAFGFVGSGNIYKIEANSIQNVMADRTGLLVGGIGRTATISDVTINLSENANIRAYRYGGLVAGEISGRLINSYVNGSLIRNNSLFVLEPLVPKALGGIAGRLYGGTIENTVMRQAFEVGSVYTSSTSDIKTAEYVGGLVGIVDGNSSKITRAIVDGEIYASGNIGGAVGCNKEMLILNEIAVKSPKIVVESSKVTLYTGGIVARAEAGLEINNSYSLADIEIENYVYRSENNVYASGFVGSSLFNPVMSYCYTTSQITAVLKDNSSVKEQLPFNILKEDETLPDEIVSFNYNMINEKGERNNFDNVYYFGYPNKSTTEDVVTYYENVSPFVTYEIKQGNSKTNLFVNNYGKPSYNISVDIEEEILVNKDVLEDVFTYYPYIIEDEKQIDLNYKPKKGEFWGGVSANSQNYFINISGGDLSEQSIANGQNFYYSVLKDSDIVPIYTSIDGVEKYYYITFGEFVKSHSEFSSYRGRIVKKYSGKALETTNPEEKLSGDIIMINNNGKPIVSEIKYSAESKWKVFNRTDSDYPTLLFEYNLSWLPIKEYSNLK